MNCRRINSLLSAYLDGELTGREMDDIRFHLRTCRSCQTEHETLQATKRMVASLALKVPREELESLLIAQGRRHETARTESPYFVRMAAWLLGTHPITLQTEDGGFKNTLPFLRPRPLAATALLSLAGFWAASASLDTSTLRDGGALAETETNWYAPGATATVSYGGEVPPAAAAAPGYLAASSSGFRPAAVLAAWLPSRSDIAVSLPLASAASSTNGGGPTWGTRLQNASLSPSSGGSPSAFVPASSVGSGGGLVPMSYGRFAGH